MRLLLPEEVWAVIKSKRSLPPPTSLQHCEGFNGSVHRRHKQSCNCLWVISFSTLRVPANEHQGGQKKKKVSSPFYNSSARSPHSRPHIKFDMGKEINVSRRHDCSDGAVWILPRLSHIILPHVLTGETTDTQQQGFVPGPFKRWEGKKKKKEKWASYNRWRPWKT